MTSVERPPETWISLAHLISCHESCTIVDLFSFLFFPAHALVTVIQLLSIIVRTSSGSEEQRGITDYLY